MTCFNINKTTMRKWCIENGIEYSRVYYYLDKKGLSVEESLKRAIGKREYPQTKFRVNGETVYGFCRDNNILYNSVVKLIKKGYDAESAIRKCKALKGKRGHPRKDFVFKKG